MAILVLGGAGYIGSHTVYALIEAGRDVVVADNLLTGFRAAVHPKARFYELDIRDRKAMDSLFEQEHIEGVIHFAASSQVGESMGDPLKYYDNNLWGTTSLLESMVAHNVKKIVLSSTAATYGLPEKMPISESDRTRPINPYGETKLAMEKMMAWTDKAVGLRYVALRYFNACGAHPGGQVVTFLWRAKGCPEPESTENPFADVKTTDYFYKAVLWSKETGVTSGTSATAFSPNKPCTRAQVVTFLWRAEGEPAPKSTDNPFADVPSEQYYTNAVLWAVEKGVTQGTGEGKFSPDATCTRGQIVTFLHRDLVE